MTETRDFPTAVIASLATGVCLCDFSEIHKAAEFLMGHPIWTHNFADKTLWQEMQKTILAQCQGMPTELPGVNEDNWTLHRERLEAKFGPTVKITRGSGLTAMLPTDGLPDHLNDNNSICIIV